jgi:hypothetical protein
MAEQVLTLVKIPIMDIEQWIRAKHVLPSILTEYRIENENLVLYFREEIPEDGPNSESSKTQSRRRRSHKKRNRMKTRGWGVVAGITNSKGQNCAIYKPFVDALQDSKLTIEEQKKLVEGILRSNRNKPSEASIQYFLENTLEYIRKQKDQSS